ncbi:MAG: DUF3365 domain-containing protein [Thermodesulfovibrionales bacterium]|nr:DUF3365 domain-containing protein [Thermodesulfovibrionales bacterium]
MKPSSLKIGTKFSLAIALILLVFCVIFSFLLYTHLKDRVIEDAEEKTLIIMTQISAVGDYVKEVLRPRMYDVLQNISDKEDFEDFIVEAMSTTHVRLEVMSRFNKNLPDYVYRRVSTKPLNPRNKADSLHEEKISYFQQDRNRKSWNGIIKIEGQEFLMRASPIITETRCLKCHGDLSQAPRGMD